MMMEMAAPKFMHLMDNPLEAIGSVIMGTGTMQYLNWPSDIMLQSDSRKLDALQPDMFLYQRYLKNTRSTGVLTHLPLTRRDGVTTRTAEALRLFAT